MAVHKTVQKVMTPPHKGDGHRKRLKEKFLENGLNGFHDYEIIELLLSLNTPRKDCKQSAKQLLKRFKTIPAVFEADKYALCEVPGVGPKNILGIKLIKAVCDRYLETKIISKDLIQNSNDLVGYLSQTLKHKNKEVFAAIFLDAKNKVVTSKILFEGTLTRSCVYPREVVESALKNNAAAVIFAHNHPSGDITPSKSDISITRELFFALQYVGIVVHEHMIVGHQGTFSFANQGLISGFNKEFKDRYVPKG